VSEFSILTGAFGSRLFLVGALFLLFLFVVFLGMGKTVLKVIFGRPPAEVMVADPEAKSAPYRDGFLTVAPVFALMALVLFLGIYIPAPLDALVREAASSLEASL
jgi:hydrogenase-4 component F